MAFSGTNELRSVDSSGDGVPKASAPVGNSDRSVSVGPRAGDKRSDQAGPEDEAADTSAGLLAAVARQDAPAFESLYRRFSKTMFSLALRIIGSRTEAEDIVSEVFIKVWTRAGDFEPERGSVFGWLATITRRKAIDRLRVRTRRYEIELELAESLGTEETDPTARTALIDQERRLRVRLALGSLKTADRRALELAYFSGLTRQEIATRMKIPTGTAKAKIRRALFALRGHLSAQAEPLGKPGESAASA